MADWRDLWRRKGNAFGILPNSRFYGPQGHRGLDRLADRGEAIPMPMAFEVVAHLTSKGLGDCIVVKTADGFRGFAHTKSRARVGAQGRPGDTVALVAGYGDFTGSLWDGSHVHTTYGPTIEHVMYGTVWDPWPGIKAAIDTSAATSGVEELIMAYIDEPQDSKNAHHDDIWQGVGGKRQFESPVDEDKKKPTTYGNILRWLVATVSAGYTGEKQRDKENRIRDLLTFRLAKNAYGDDVSLLDIINAGERKHDALAAAFLAYTEGKTPAEVRAIYYGRLDTPTKAR